MALPASTVLSSTPTFRISLYTRRPYQPRNCSLFHLNCLISPKCSKRMIVAQIGEPNDKVKVQLSMVRERLWEAVPSSVKEFPWKKAGNVFSEQMISYGENTLKWPLIAVFIVSSLSDTLFSISRSLELMIPLGLLVGCLLTDFLREILQQLFLKSEENNSRKRILGVGCFLVFLKLISANFAIRSHVFLLHVANGGLMQVIWLWRRSRVEENESGNAENSMPTQDASLTVNPHD